MIATSILKFNIALFRVALRSNKQRLKITKTLLESAIDICPDEFVLDLGIGLSVFYDEIEPQNEQ